MLSRSEHNAAIPPFPLLGEQQKLIQKYNKDKPILHLKNKLHIQLFTTAGLPANLLRHSHRHLLVLATTPIRQRTTADINMS